MLALCAASWIGACALGDRLADWAEVKLGAHLWREQEWMDLFEPSRYAWGEGRAFHVLGPSESREAFWPAPFFARAGFDVFVNDSLSMSHLDDAVTQLEYIERNYGAEAIGETLVLAVTPRFVLGHAPGERPLPIALNRYSPHFALDESALPQQLVGKSLPAALLARVRLAAHSSTRHRAALGAASAWLRAGGSRERLEANLRASYLVSARYAALSPRAKSTYYEWVEEGRGLYREMRTLDPRTRRDAVLRAFLRVREIAARGGARVLVVTMPEGGWLRTGFYDAGYTEAYRDLLCEAAAGLPIVDLRGFLADEEFFDWSHPTYSASLRISGHVAGEIVRLDAGQELESPAKCRARSD